MSYSASDADTDESPFFESTDHIVDVLSMVHL